MSKLGKNTSVYLLKDTEKRLKQIEALEQREDSGFNRNTIINKSIDEFYINHYLDKLKPSDLMEGSDENI